MTHRERRTVPLPAEHAEHVAGRRLRIGKRVVRAGLRALQELEAAAIDQWSQDKVARSMTQYSANPIAPFPPVKCPRRRAPSWRAASAYRASANYYAAMAV